MAPSINMNTRYEKLGTQGKKVLFISHDATRTGAPIFLLHFLSWLKTSSNVSFEIILKKGGELEGEFQQLAPTLVLDKLTVHRSPLIKRLIRRLKLLISGISLDKNCHSSIKSRYRPGDVALVYSNTITNGELLKQLSYLGCPVISHALELEYVIQLYGGNSNIALVKNYTSLFIAVSYEVKDNLIKKHGVDAKKIEVIYLPTPTCILSTNEISKCRSTIRDSLGIPNDALVIGSAGTIDWRKGTDLFGQLASQICKLYSDTPVHFIWIGGSRKDVYFERLWYDITLLDLQDRVHFVESTPTPLSYFTAIDIFTVLSREEPLSLVMLEAASLGIPILCFDKGNGTKEFVNDDCGYVVPYLDIGAMADKIIQLIRSPRLCTNFGERAVEKIREKHNILIQNSKALELINKFLK